MASNLFKTRYLLNSLMQDSTSLTNANTVYVHTLLGDDSTGDGTREKPYRSFTKANLKAGITYVLFRGIIDEYFVINKHLIGDDINQFFNQGNLQGSTDNVNSLTLSGITFGNTNIVGCIIKPYAPNITLNLGFFYSMSGSLVLGTLVWYAANGNSSIYIGSTIWNYASTRTNAQIADNFIVCGYWSLLNILQDRLRYTVYLSTCVFTKTGGAIIQPVWTDDSKANVALIRQAYINAGYTAAQMLELFPKDIYGNETCRIIKQAKDGGASPNVFNRYDTNKTTTLNGAITAGAKTSVTVVSTTDFPDSGAIFIGTNGDVFIYTSKTASTLVGSSQTLQAHNSGETVIMYGFPLDYTLNPDVTNEALWASSTGGYVGCFKPSASPSLNAWSSIINVNTDGTDTANAGDLININAGGSMVFNSASSQIWNRMRDASSIHIQAGSKFKGLNGMSQDGSPFGYFIGKKQSLIDATVKNPGDALTAGVWYKVFNDASKDVTKSIIYNGVQYLPSYTFLCLATPTTFSLLNAGSGSYVKKMLTDVLESVEILPYDDATTPSAFPKFSAPLMGECKLLYYTSAGATRYGKTAGTPVLFGDLAVANFQTDFPGCNDKIAYYDGYAISNADQEFFTLANPALTSPKSTYFTVAIPTLTYLRREINAHYDANYNF